ncbi:MAG: ABC transporter permease, partial [Alphaproteobacteria bacterium]|nr:ABC transporter permease [Alphaproteobacteria bacterium]
MSGFFARRLMQGIISIIGASIIIFVISRLSGDPILMLLPNDAPASMIEETRRNLGLDRPLWVQYL